MKQVNYMPMISSTFIAVMYKAQLAFYKTSIPWSDICVNVELATIMIHVDSSFVFNLFFYLVDGVWQEWGQWRACSVTCGGSTHLRYRVCTPPKFGGLDCQGSGRDEKPCGEAECPGEQMG